MASTGDTSTIRPIRVLVTLVVLFAVAIFLILLAAAFVVGFIWISGVLGLQHALGEDTQSSKNYASASGIVPVVVASLGFSSVLVAAIHHLNCHQAGCPRIGRYPVAGGKYKTCRRHHPDPVVREGVQSQHLLAAHEEHQRR